MGIRRRIEYDFNYTIFAHSRRCKSSISFSGKFKIHIIGKRREGGVVQPVIGFLQPSHCNLTSQHTPVTSPNATHATKYSEVQPSHCNLTSTPQSPVTSALCRCNAVITVHTWCNTHCTAVHWSGAQPAHSQQHAHPSPILHALHRAAGRAMCKVVSNLKWMSSVKCSVSSTAISAAGTSARGTRYACANSILPSPPCAPYPAPAGITHFIWRKGGVPIRR